MLRSICAVKLVDGKNNEKLMKMLGSEEKLDKMAKINDLSSHKLWLEENSPSRIAEKRKRQTRQKPFSLLHLTRARSHLPESDNANVCYVVSHNSFLSLFVELGPSRNSPSYNWREE